MRYIDLTTKDEWFGEQPIPEHVITVADDAPCFSPIPNGKKLLWITQPTLFDMSEEEMHPQCRPKEFILRFTIEELLGIYVFAATNVQVRIWIDQLMASEYVVCTDLTLQTGMAYMVYQGLITQQRFDEIMV